MVLIKNLKIFHLFIFGKISKQNVFDDILERKKAFLYYKKHKVKKVENQNFSKGVSPWFLIKNLKFFHLFIIVKISKQNVFDDILERKKAFLYYKKHKVKKVENQNFSKGVSPWFLIKNLKFFHLFIIVKISQQNVFDDILEMKKAFLDYKKQKVKTVKNWDFSRGVSP